MNLSDNLKRIRKENNLSQEDLAEKLGVSRQSVSKWESGAAYPEMDKVIQLCKMFDLNIDELLNKNVNEVKDNKQSKININKYIDDFLSFVTKTINMFKILFLFVVFLGIGYAFLEATLTIDGDTTVTAPELNVYVQSTSVTSGSTSGTPTIIGNDKKEVDFSTALTNDGNSFFEETTTLVNKGTKKAY